ESLRTRPSSQRTLPTAGASMVVTIFSTPGGKPASCPSLAIASAQSGVPAAGLTTIVHPAASAGATFRVIMAIGKFQGAIAATTPMGCLMVRYRLDATVVGIVRP